MGTEQLVGLLLCVHCGAHPDQLSHSSHVVHPYCPQVAEQLLAACVEAGGRSRAAVGCYQQLLASGAPVSGGAHAAVLRAHLQDVTAAGSATAAAAAVSSAVVLMERRPVKLEELGDAELAAHVVSAAEHALRTTTSNGHSLAA